MKFMIGVMTIRETVAFSMGAVNNRPPSPIMAGLLIEAKESAISVTGDDYEKRSTATGQAEVHEPGETLVNGKLLESIVSKLKASKPVKFNVEGRLMQVSQGARVYSIPTMGSKEYPALKLNLQEIGGIDGKTFAGAVKSVAPYASKDHSVEVINGVNAVFGEQVILQATDRYRIAESVMDWDSRAPETRMIVPAAWLLGTVKYAGGEVVFSIEENNGKPSRLAISCGPYMTVTSLLNGDFPKVESLAEVTKNHLPATFDREELREAVDSIAMMAERNTPVRVALKNEVATIDAGSEDGGLGIAQIKVDHQEDLTLGFNPTFLLDGLKAHDSDKVTLNIANPNKPVIITGTENVKYTAMPVRLSSQN